MADSDITISSLAIIPGIGQLVLIWNNNDPNADGLPYLQQDVTEIWRSTGSFASASKVASVKGNAYVDAGLASGTTYRYWLRAKDRSGQFGEYTPLSTQAGSAGTVLNSFTASFLGSSQQSMTITSGDGITINVNSGGSGLVINNNAGGTAVRINTAAGGSAFSVDVGGGGSAFNVSATAGGSPFTVNHSGGGSGFKCNHSGSGSGFFCLQSGSGFAFFALGGGYGPFTGAHVGLISKDRDIEPGDIVCDVRVVARAGISDTLTEVARSSAPRDCSAVGVFVSRWEPEVDEQGFPVSDEDASLYDRVIFNGLGEGQINVCGENGPIEAGDLLVTSSVPGNAMRQDDDLVRACTLARAREGANLNSPAERAKIACIYLCG
jgi:hypothetical protein